MEDLKKDLINQQDNSPCKPKIGSTPVQFYKSSPDEEPFIVKRTEGDTRHKVDLFNERIKEILGVKDYEVAMEILSTATRAVATTDGLPDPYEAFNYILQSIYDLKPQDAIEARLTAQAAVLYKHSMIYLGKAGNVNSLEYSERYTNLGIKLLRAHNESIEALGKHRRGGKQTIVIQQQQVNLSGQAQAMVGNFSEMGTNPKNEGDTP